MIQYTLRCSEGHQFDSWFQSGSAFDTLKAAGHVTCVTCGTSDVDKAIMAPRVTASRSKATPVPSPENTSATDSDTQKALAEMKRNVEANSDYVGGNFASEARSMHLGDTPERSIYGEANAKEAKALIEEGVPVLPLPFTPTRKTN